MQVRGTSSSKTTTDMAKEEVEDPTSRTVMEEQGGRTNTLE